MQARSIVTHSIRFRAQQRPVACKSIRHADMNLVAFANGETGGGDRRLESRFLGLVVITGIAVMKYGPILSPCHHSILCKSHRAIPLRCPSKVSSTPRRRTRFAQTAISPACAAHRAA